MSNDYRLSLLSEELDKYKAAVLKLTEENKELKNIIKTHNPWYKCKNCNKDYKQALEEIRDMCNNTCEKNKDCSNSCYECKSIDEPAAINRILNKVNEVLK